MSNFLYGVALASFASQIYVIDVDTVKELGKLAMNKNDIMQADAQQILQAFRWFNIDVPGDLLRKLQERYKSQFFKTSNLIIPLNSKGVLYQEEINDVYFDPKTTEYRNGCLIVCKSPLITGFEIL